MALIPKIHSRHRKIVNIALTACLTLVILSLLSPLAAAAATGSVVSVHLTVVDSLAVSLSGDAERSDRIIQIGSRETGNVGYVALDR